MTRTPSEAYRELKPRYPNTLLAFIRGEMIWFLRADAQEVHKQLMLEMDATAEYDRVAVHKSLYFQIKERKK